MRKYLTEFFGYGGTTGAKVWFVGLEEAGGKDPWKELQDRSNLWKERTRCESIVDLKEFHGEQELPANRTWTGIIKMISAWKGTKFPKNSLARSNSDHALLELRSIARRNGQVKVKDEIFELIDKECLATTRIKGFKALYGQYKPKVIVFYGRSKEAPEFIKSIGSTYPGFNGTNPLHDDSGPSRIITVRHPTNGCRNAILSQVGQLIAEGIDLKR